MGFSYSLYLIHLTYFDCGLFTHSMLPFLLRTPTLFSWVNDSWLISNNYNGAIFVNCSLVGINEFLVPAGAALWILCLKVMFKDWIHTIMGSARLNVYESILCIS